MAGWSLRRGAQPAASCWESAPVDPFHAPTAAAPCVPDAGPRAIRSATSLAAAHTGQHRWFRATAICACRQDTRVAGVRQSARASSPPGESVGRTTTTRDHGVSGGVAVAKPTPMPACALWRRDTGSARRCGPSHGGQCWGLAPIPSPSAAANGRRRGPGSRFHVLRHSDGGRIMFA